MHSLLRPETEHLQWRKQPRTKSWNTEFSTATFLLRWIHGDFRKKQETGKLYMIYQTNSYKAFNILILNINAYHSWQWSPTFKWEPGQHLLGQKTHTPFPRQGSPSFSLYMWLSPNRNIYLWKHIVYLHLYLHVIPLNMLLIYICYLLLAPAET